MATSSLDIIHRTGKMANPVQLQMGVQELVMVMVTGTSFLFLLSEMIEVVLFFTLV